MNKFTLIKSLVIVFATTCLCSLLAVVSPQEVYAKEEVESDELETITEEIIKDGLKTNLNLVLQGGEIISISLDARRGDPPPRSDEDVIAGTFNPWLSSVNIKSLQRSKADPTLFTGAASFYISEGKRKKKLIGKAIVRAKRLEGKDFYLGVWQLIHGSPPEKIEGDYFVNKNEDKSYSVKAKGSFSAKVVKKKPTETEEKKKKKKKRKKK